MGLTLSVFSSKVTACYLRKDLKGTMKDKGIPAGIQERGDSRVDESSMSEKGS